MSWEVVIPGKSTAAAAAPKKRLVRGDTEVELEC
jgi:hypothetical protein